MSSSDVRDVLNLPDGLSAARPAKKQKAPGPRSGLKGLAREVHSLGGDNPIAIVPEVTQFKKRRLASRKPAARWELRDFRNSARNDTTLILKHWRRKEVKLEAQPTGLDGARVPPQDEIEDSAFAKYNVEVSAPHYTDEQYSQALVHDEWSKEETDYLMELARDFDLRWPLIWDRYEWNPPATNGEATEEGDESKAIIPVVQTRAMEDLKARYYEVAAKMMALHKPVQYMSQPEFALHELMAHYNPQQEKLRKDFAMNSLARSRDEVREEESLLLEVKRILARSEKFNEERRELYNRLDYPHAEQDINTFKSSTGLQTLLQNLMTVDKSKKRKSLLGAEAGGTPGPAGAQAAGPDSAKRENPSAGHRDSVGATSTPTAASKKGTPLQAQERKKLNDQEEAIYGITHHERLSSGPTFRTEKINKLFSHKSHQQQNRITNTLNELDVPNKLAMPTIGTTQQFEALLAAVNSLLDARKVFDKLEAEIKVEQAKKAEREKTNGEGEEESKPNEDSIEVDTSETKPTVSLEDEGDTTAAPDADTEAAEKEKSGRPGSSGMSNKRSASVLSTVSDKSAKRQKK